MNWKKFQIGKLFNIVNGQPPKNKKKGDTPYVSTTRYHNGVSEYINHKPNASANTITISKNGSVGEVFYHPQPYFASPDVCVLIPKYSQFNEAMGLFIATMIKREKYRASYFNKPGEEDIKNMCIQLPVENYLDENNSYSEEGYIPAWAYIEDFIKSKTKNVVYAKNTKHNLKEVQWGEYRVGDYFEISPTKTIKDIKKMEMSETGTPLIVNSYKRNGVYGYYPLEATEKGNIITFSDTDSSNGNTIFYQPKEFIGFPHVQGMRPKFKEANEKTLLFIVTALRQEVRKRYTYSVKMKRELITNTIIRLPSTDSGEPDWKYIEKYISDIIRKN